MNLKGDSSSKQMPKKKTKKKPTPKSDYKLVNEDTHKNNSDIKEYTVKGQVNPL